MLSIRSAQLAISSTNFYTARRMNPTYLNSIKSFEGFTPRAEWDYAQHTNGYGTRALFPGETISPKVAEQRFNQEIATARAIVEKHAKNWDEGTKAALTSLTFNAGTRWISSGLGEAVRGHDIQMLKERFSEYNKAQGHVLPGLVARRLAESAWIGAEAQAPIAANETTAMLTAAEAVPSPTKLAPPAIETSLRIVAVIPFTPNEPTYGKSTAVGLQNPHTGPAQLADFVVNTDFHTVRLATAIN